jgi:hypothetical protein
MTDIRERKRLSPNATVREQANAHALIPATTSSRQVYQTALSFAFAPRTTPRCAPCVARGPVHPVISVQRASAGEHDRPLDKPCLCLLA